MTKGQDDINTNIPGHCSDFIIIRDIIRVPRAPISEPLDIAVHVRVTGVRLGTIGGILSEVRLGRGQDSDLAEIHCDENLWALLYSRDKSRVWVHSATA